MGFDKIAAICQMGTKISDPDLWSRQFANQPLVDHSKSGYVQFSDPHYYESFGIKILDLSAIFNSIFTY